MIESNCGLFVSRDMRYVQPMSDGSTQRFVFALGFFP